jgi:uncharacterized protein (TIGR02117 family)
VPLSAAEYRRLAAYIAATFAPAAGGRAVPIRGYGPDDVFYAARGRYSALRSCNEWARRGLAHAGVRVGMWSPFAGGVMRWL